MARFSLLLIALLLAACDQTSGTLREDSTAIRKEYYSSKRYDLAAKCMVSYYNDNPAFGFMNISPTNTLDVFSAENRASITTAHMGTPLLVTDIQTQNEATSVKAYISVKVYTSGYHMPIHADSLIGVVEGAVSHCNKI